MNTKRYNNMFTKTQIKIMKFFVSKITERFSLREVGKKLNIHQALTYRSCRSLIKNKIIISDKEQYKLNYKDNHQDLAYFESIRSKEFLNNPNNKVFSMFAEEVIDKFPYSYFTFLIFGSTVETSKPRDTDVLIIIEKTEEIETAEKILFNISRNYTLNLHFVVISFESVFEMLALRDEKNVINEVLNKHLIIYGAELFYRLIKKGRK